MSHALRVPFARTLVQVVLAGAALLPLASRVTFASDKTAIEIAPGPRSMSPEEKTMAPDPAHGAQHGIILVDESVRDESTGTETNLVRHVRAKIFSNEGRRLGDISIEHDRETGLLKRWWGFTVSPDGTVLEVKQSELREQELAKTRVGRLAVMKASLPGITPGCIIDYGYVIQERGIYKSNRVDIQGQSPVKLFRFRWAPFTGATASFGLVHAEGLDLDMTQGQRSVLVTGSNLPAVMDEPYMPPDAESHAQALFYYRASASKAKEFWDLEAQRLFRRAGTFAREKQLSQAIAAMKIPAGADLMTKLKTAYDWISANIRNTTLQMAEEAEAARSDDREKPESWKTAQDILTAGQGNGRELDFLFFGLARALGAEAYPVLGTDRTDHYFNRDYLSVDQLDWVLVAIKAKGDPDDKLVFVDLGSGLPFGEVPWWITGSQALLASDQGHRLIFLPPSDPRKNVSETRVQITFNLDEGTERVTSITDDKCQQGLYERWRLRGLSPEERTKELEDSCGASGVMEITRAQAPNLQDLAAGYHLECEGTVTDSNFSHDLGRYSFGFLGPWVTGPPRFTSPTRSMNVVFDFPRIDSLVLDVKSPPGFVATEVKAPPLVESPFGRYTLKISATPEGYHVERLYALSAVAVPAKEYDTLRRFFDDVARADATRLEFRRSEGP